MHNSLAQTQATETANKQLFLTQRGEIKIRRDQYVVMCYLLSELIWQNVARWCYKQRCSKMLQCCQHIIMLSLDSGQILLAMNMYHGCVTYLINPFCLNLIMNHLISIMKWQLFH